MVVRFFKPYSTLSVDAFDVNRCANALYSDDRLRRSQDGCRAYYYKQCSKKKSFHLYTPYVTEVLQLLVEPIAL